MSHFDNVIITDQLTNVLSRESLERGQRSEMCRIARGKPRSDLDPDLNRAAAAAAGRSANLWHMLSSGPVTKNCTTAGFVRRGISYGRDRRAPNANAATISK